MNRAMGKEIRKENIKKCDIVWDKSTMTHRIRFLDGKRINPDVANRVRFHHIRFYIKDEEYNMTRWWSGMRVAAPLGSSGKQEFNEILEKVYKECGYPDGYVVENGKYVGLTKKTKEIIHRLCEDLNAFSYEMYGLGEYHRC